MAYCGKCVFCRIGMAILAGVLFLLIIPFATYAEPKQVKIMFYSYTKTDAMHFNVEEWVELGGMLSETSPIAPPQVWAHSLRGPLEGQTTIQEMVNQGWELKQIVPINMNQGYLYFLK